MNNHNLSLQALDVGHVGDDHLVGACHGGQALDGGLVPVVHHTNWDLFLLQPWRRKHIIWLVGLVLEASASRAAHPEFDSRFLRGDLSRSSRTSDLQTGTPVATLPGAWRYMIGVGTGWPSVSTM